MLRKMLWFSTLVVVLASTLLVAAPLAAQDDLPPRLIAPSGPYPVGRTALAWVDESRPEIHTEDPDDLRELLVEVWYPAAPAPDTRPGLYLEAPMAELFALMANVPAADVQAIYANAYPDAPLAGDEPAYPVILFEPGFSAAPRQYTVLIEELASHGYVVFAPSHPYVTTLVVYPDGRTVEPINYNRLSSMYVPESVYTGEFEQVWVPDATFVLEQIAALDQDDPAGLFTGRLDLDRMGMVGHSQGGRTISEVCLDEPRCAGAVSLDSSHSARVALGFDRPYMMMEADNGVQSFINTFERGMEALAQDYYVIMIPQTAHNSFDDVAFWAPLVYPDINPTIVAGAQYALLDYRLYLLAFFDKHVRGMEVPLLDGPSQGHPEVFFLRRHAAIAGPTANAEPQVAVLGREGNRGELARGAADVWLVDGQAGDMLNIFILADKPANNTDEQQRLEYGLLDTLLVVRDPDGELLAVNDDMGMTTNSQLTELALPVDGTYIIEVRSWENQNEGGYTLIVDPVTPRE